MKKKSANLLINEKSTYLLQHAYNPVNWIPWSDSLFEKAEKDGKLVIISIGYSACHWCHVMENESFEDDQIASLMNDNFICVKVDKEERPDVDMLYMEAVQLLGGHGGWPLNCITLPNGKPFYGGTYFNKKQWSSLLNQIVDLYKDNRKKLIAQANRLTDAVNSNEFEKAHPIHKVSSSFLKEAIEKWKRTIDPTYGGSIGAPKFPMPTAINHLMHCYTILGDETLFIAAKNQLNKMYFGGIYDHLQGGFSRYSTDEKWFAPHFEKMLYDNAQLIGTYSIAFQLTKDEYYSKIVRECIDFLNSDLYCKNVGYFSSIDADSEGVEGKFYTWKFDEIKEHVSDINIENFFNVQLHGNWDNGRNILFLSCSEEEYCKAKSIELKSFKSELEKSKKILLKARNKREKPIIDSKVLTCWNALTVTGLIQAYNAIQIDEYLKKAIEIGNLFCKRSIGKDFSLQRTMNYTSNSINGFLDDYAFTIQAFIELYQTTFDQKWLDLACNITNYCIDNFKTENGHLFYYCNSSSNKLVGQKMEMSDNVIPSSNSQMAINLYLLGLIYVNQKFIDQAIGMCSHILPYYRNSPGYYANWGKLINWVIREPIQIVITGKDSKKFKKELNDFFLPNFFFCGSETESSIPIFEGKYLKDKTAIYICHNKSCLHTIYSTKEAALALNKLI